MRTGLPTMISTQNLLKMKQECQPLNHGNWWNYI